MKKSLFIIAAAALAFAACTENDSFKKDINENSGEGEAINFSTFSEKLTRAENSDALYRWAFINNHSTFQVWAIKDVAPSADKAVFNGETVTVAGDGSLANTTYTYSPLKFWDKTANKYHFYAAAPAQPTGDSPAWQWEFVGTGIAENAINAGYFKTTSTITGVNLKNESNNGPSTSLSDYFKDKADVDKMIAAPCDFEKSRYAKANPEAVNLNFIHILSKLNVTVRKGANISNDAYVVVLKKFEIKNMQGKGDFTESSVNNLATGTNSRWNTSNYSDTKANYVALTVSNPTGYTVTNSANYIVESLVIPQDITYKTVALDGKAKEAVVHADAVLFTNYAEYCAAKPVETLLSEEAFNTLKAQAEAGDPNDAQFAEIVKVPEVEAQEAIDAVADYNNNPYFVITYTINNDEVTYYYNLAAAFGAKAADDTETANIDERVIAFNEGWQNTLNIVINPDKIEFTADVAEWANGANKTVYITEEE